MFLFIYVKYPKFGFSFYKKKISVFRFYNIIMLLFESKIDFKYMVFVKKKKNWTDEIQTYSFSLSLSNLEVVSGAFAGTSKCWSQRPQL